MLRCSSRAGLCLADKQKHCRIWCHSDGFSVGTNDYDESVAANSCGTLVACPPAILPTLSPRTQQCSHLSLWEHQTSQRLVMTVVRLEWFCCSVKHCNIVFWILFSLPSLTSKARCTVNKYNRGDTACVSHWPWNVSNRKSRSIGWHFCFVSWESPGLILAGMPLFRGPVPKNAMF